MEAVRFFKRTCICSVISILFIFSIPQKASAQNSTIDSLKQALDFFQINISDSGILYAVQEAQISLRNNAPTDTLIVKLFALENTLFRTQETDKGTILHFFLLVEHLIEQQPEKKWETISEDLNNRAYIYVTMALYEKATHLYQQALTVTKKAVGEEHAYYYSILTNLSHAWENMGLYKKADSAYKRVLVIIEKVSGTQSYEYAAALNNLAGLYKDLSLYKEALPLYNQAIPIMKATIGDQHPLYAVCINNLALIYEEMGIYEKSLQLYNQGLLIIKEAYGEKYSDYTSALNNLAKLYKKMGDYSSALPLYEQVLSIDSAGMGKETSDYAKTLNNLADLYLAMGLYNKAHLQYQQALAIQKKVFGDEHPDYAKSLNGLANSYFSTRNYLKADSLYHQALIVRKNTLGEQHPDYIESLQNVGLVSLFLNKNRDAFDSVAKSDKLRLLNIAINISTLSEEEKLAMLNIEGSNFDLLPSLLLTENTKDEETLKQLYNTELLVKGMVLEDLQTVLRSIRESGDSAALNLYEEWRLNKQVLGKQLLLPIKERAPYLDSLQNVTNELEQSLSRISLAFNNQQQSEALTADDIEQNLLKEHAAAIEFIQFQLYNKKWTDSIMYAALLLLPGDTAVKFILLCEEKQLQDLLLSRGFENVEVSNATKYRGISNNQSALSNDSLYLLIWKPLEKYLNGIKTIYFSPAGLLHRVAFNALKPNKAYLLDKYNLKQVLSTRSVVFGEEGNIKAASANIWGNIEYNRTDDSRYDQKDTAAADLDLFTLDTREMRGEGFDSLPGAIEELYELENIFQQANVVVTIDSGAAATEEHFKALDGKSPQILHLATHGFFLRPIDTVSKDFSNPENKNSFAAQQNSMFRSGLALAGANYTWKGNLPIQNKEDGILTAYEIAQMDLSHTGLAVLSACETGLGDIEGNEGVIGLQRALKLAGVKQVIMSLWRVPDNETKELMTMFYNNWLQGQSTREALQSAQLKMKEKYSFFYWAAFVLVE